TAAGSSRRILISVSVASGTRAPSLDDAHLHLDALVRVVAAVPGRAHDLVRDLDALRDAAERRVLPIEEAGVLDADEELTARAVRVVGPRHGQHAALVRGVVELGLDGVAGSPRAVLAARSLRVLGVRIAALDHEARDHAVERGAVVEALPGQ